MVIITPSLTLLPGTSIWPSKNMTPVYSADVPTGMGFVQVSSPSSATMGDTRGLVAL